MASGSLSESRRVHSDLSVCLIEPPSLCVEDDHVEPSLGLLYLAGMARARGYSKVRVADMTGCQSEADVAARLDAIPYADVYGIRVVCTNHQFAKRLVARIRQDDRLAYVVAGGPNPSALPQLSLDDLGVDAVVRGEGEVAFVRILDSITRGQPLRGILEGTPLEDIDDYPFPARELVDMSTYSRRLEGRPVHTMVSSRGCAHRCAHCNSIVMNLKRKKPAFRSAESVIDEIASLPPSSFGIRFNDDHFTGNPRLFALLDRLAPLAIPFRVFARVEDLTPNVCTALRKAGCVHVSVGMESLNPENLRALGRHSQIGHEGLVRVAREHGLVVRGYFMVGLPHDSDASVMHAAEQAAKLGLHEFSVYPLLPYPASPIANHPERFGYRVVDLDFTHYVQIGLGGDAGLALVHESFGIEDVRRWRRLVADVLRAGGAVDSHRSCIAT
jgi:anaerobic magnesium-protoporphyrin IX monomethyl ester cyclase